jgi:hypothetical protein
VGISEVPDAEPELLLQAVSPMSKALAAITVKIRVRRIAATLS